MMNKGFMPIVVIMWLLWNMWICVYTVIPQHRFLCIVVQSSQGPFSSYSCWFYCGISSCSLHIWCNILHFYVYSFLRHSSCMESMLVLPHVSLAHKSYLDSCDLKVWSPFSTIFTLHFQSSLHLTSRSLNLEASSLLDVQGTNGTVKYLSLLYHFYLFFTSHFLLSQLLYALSLFAGLPPFLSVSLILMYPLSPQRTISALSFSGYPMCISLSENSLRCSSFSSHGKSG